MSRRLVFKFLGERSIFRLQQLKSLDQFFSGVRVWLDPWQGGKAYHGQDINAQDTMLDLPSARKNHEEGIIAKA